MSYSRIKTWVKEILYYEDQNAEFDNVIDALNALEAAIPTITDAAETLLDDLTIAAMWTTLGIAFGTGSGTFCEGDDSRLSDTRVPTAGSVDQGTLDVTLGSASTTDVNGDPIVVTGGLFAFYPQIKASSGNTCHWGKYNAGASLGAAAWSTSTSFATIMNLSTTAGTGYAQWNYITASPPYDLGDGNVAGFIYLLVDKVTGDIITVSAAEDPPWFGNIPKPKKETNKLFGMEKMPHPFPGYDQKSKMLVMLDPMSDVVKRLFEEQAEGQGICESIADKRIAVGRKIVRAVPPGVQAFDVRWR